MLLNIREELELYNLQQHAYGLLVLLKLWWHPWQVTTSGELLATWENHTYLIKYSG